jgi:hypothetical protein
MTYDDFGGSVTRCDKVICHAVAYFLGVTKTLVTPLFLGVIFRCDRALCHTMSRQREINRKLLIFISSCVTKIHATSCHKCSQTIW